MYKKLQSIVSLLLVMLLGITTVKGQEIQARVTVMAPNVTANAADKKIFQTLQKSLNDFLNGRKWSNDNFQPNEKIQCNFLLNIEQQSANNVYKARLTVQAARPIFNTNYDSPIINFIDDRVASGIPSYLTGFQTVCYPERSIFPSLSNRLVRSCLASIQELGLSWGEA